MGKEERNAYTIKNDANIGEVKIADEVVAIIAGLAAMEVEGVASMAGNATNPDRYRFRLHHAVCVCRGTYRWGINWPANGPFLRDVLRSR